MKIIFVLMISFVWLMTMIHFYRKDDDPEACGHENLPSPFDVGQTCAFCKAKYVALKEKEDWLQCKLCEQWFH